MGTLGMEVKTETSNLPPDFKYKESANFVEGLTEDDKGQWIELSDNELKNQMPGLMGYMYDKEIDNADWDTPNSKTYGADYHEEKFPGFDQLVYQVLKESTKDEKKVSIIDPVPG